jgi:hypothetical protein
MQERSPMAAGPTLVEIQLKDGEIIELETSTPPALKRRVGPAAGGKVEGLVVSFDEAVRRVRTLTGMLFDSLASLPKMPESVEIELGIKLGGKVGVIVTEGTTEANLKLIIKWKAS